MQYLANCFKRGSYKPPEYLSGIQSLPDEICNQAAMFSNPFTPEKEAEIDLQIKTIGKQIQERNIRHNVMRNDGQSAAEARVGKNARRKSSGIGSQ